MRKEIIGNATLYCGDCMEGMQEMSDKAFDLAIVDPPYTDKIVNVGIVDKERWAGGEMPEYNTPYGNRPPAAYFDDLKRVADKQIVWGMNYFAKELGNAETSIVWDKKIPEESYYSQFELAWTSWKSKSRIFRYLWSGFRQEWGKEERIHPTQKPVNLYKWLLANYAKPGQTILDTHLGSGSSVIACLDRGHNVTAYEIDEEYFDAACLRIEQSLQQLKLAL